MNKDETKKSPKLFTYVTSRATKPFCFRRRSAKPLHSLYAQNQSLSLSLRSRLCTTADHNHSEAHPKHIEFPGEISALHNPIRLIIRLDPSDGSGFSPRQVQARVPGRSIRRKNQHHHPIHVRQVR